MFKKVQGYQIADVGFFKSTLYIWNIVALQNVVYLVLKRPAKTSIAFWRQVCADIVLNTYKKCSEFFFRDNKENTASKNTYYLGSY